MGICWNRLNRVILTGSKNICFWRERGKNYPHLWFFSFFSEKTFIVGTSLNHLTGTSLTDTHNIQCLWWKSSFFFWQNYLFGSLVWSSEDLKQNKKLVQSEIGFCNYSEFWISRKLLLHYTVGVSCQSAVKKSDWKQKNKNNWKASSILLHIL